MHSSIDIIFIFVSSTQDALSKQEAGISSELGDAVVSHQVFADVHKLMCEDSDADSEDKEVVIRSLL